MENVVAVKRYDLLAPQDKILADHAHVINVPVERLIAIYLPLGVPVVLELPVINLRGRILMR